MEGSTKFYSDDVVVENPLPIDDIYQNIAFVTDYIGNSIDTIIEFFELDKALNWITEGGYKRIALQLPDFYLKWAFEITRYLEERVKGKIYILGDSSYRSCCVDRVAAEHANCDSLIHFGEACLSSGIQGNIPTFYIYCKFNLELNDLKNELQTENVQNYLKDENVTNIALLYDSSFAHSSKNLEQIVRDGLSLKKTLVTCHIVEKPQEEYNGIILGRKFDKIIQTWTDSATLIFIGFDDSPLLPIWLMTFVQFTKIIHFSPKEKRIKLFDSASQIRLRKRLFLIEKLRDANTVGLVVGTLAVAGFRESIQRIRQLCKVAQKKLYVVSIGKINEAKLSNFASDIDAFVLLSCPFGVILNTGDYYKPILSFFEAEIALNPSKNWYSGGGWTAQINEFLKDEIGLQDFEEVDVSLLSGRIRHKQIAESVPGEDLKNHQIIQYSAGKTSFS